MNLGSFVQEGDNGKKVQQIFGKGVRMIYQDALNHLISNVQLLDKLIDMDSVPEEITADFLKNLETPLPKEIKKPVNMPIKILKEYNEWDSVNPKSFASFFVSRYKAISQFLWRRPQLKNTVSINQFSKIKGKDVLSIIGMVRDLRVMNDGRKMLLVEDLSGATNVMIPSNIPGGNEIVTDEVIGFQGHAGRDILFANSVIFPDVPLVEWPRAQRPHALFISDIHVGSKKFLEGVWDNFVSWIKEHKEVKYIFVAGDLVDGIGMYKNQVESLDIDTSEGQIEAFAKYMAQLRGDVKIFAISGNHDPNRDSEPQPVFPEGIGKPLKKLGNLEMHSNPSWIEVEGITVLLYHGTSLDSIVASVETIKNEGYQKPYLGQIHLLKKRHLSPIFGRNKVFPDKDDFMVINKIPHVFHTGHIHKLSISSYRGIRLISSGTFQDTTDFQEKLGHKPSPGKFVLMNLSDGSSTPIDFSRVT